MGFARSPRLLQQLLHLVPERRHLGVLVRHLPVLADQKDVRPHDPVLGRQGTARLEDVRGAEIEGLRPLCALRLQGAPGGHDSRDDEKERELARIEATADSIFKLCSEPWRGRIVEEFRRLGFNYVSIDLEGFRSGSLNAMVPVEMLSKR